MNSPSRPLPQVDAESKHFWEGCRRHEFRLQRCRSCGEYRFYPRAICPFCHSTDFDWEVASGRGCVYTFTIVRQNRQPFFAQQVPYVLAVVALDEGVQVMTNIVECPPEQVQIGMPVEVCFEDATEEIGIPLFHPRATLARA